MSATSLAVTGRGEDGPAPEAPPPGAGEAVTDYLLRAARLGDSLVCLDVKRRRYLAHHPDAVRHILLQNHRGYRPMTPERPLMGHRSLTMSTGDAWLQRRRLMQPLFQPRRLERLLPHAVDVTGSMVERFRAVEAGRTVDVGAEMVRLSLETLIATLFGPPGARDETLRKTIREAFEYFNARAARGGRALPIWLPTPGNLRLKRALGGLRESVLRRIAERRREPGELDDMLSSLLGAKDPQSGATLNDDELVDELMMLLVMGHMTTAMALTWTWYLVARHPEVERRLAVEIAAVLGDRPPVVDDLEGLVYTRRVIDEALRLYPPTWALARGAQRDDVVAGVPVTAGSTIVLSPWVTHRNPDFWPDPDRFDPDRFLPERCAGRHRFAYFPFGAGPRACIAQQFAGMEMPLIVARVLQDFRLELAAEEEVQVMPIIALMPRGGLPLKFHPRSASDPG